jgi:hypothetical protein
MCARGMGRQASGGTPVNELDQVMFCHNATPACTTPRGNVYNSNLARRLCSHSQPQPCMRVCACVACQSRSKYPGMRAGVHLPLSRPNVERERGMRAGVHLPPNAHLSLSSPNAHLCLSTPNAQARPRPGLSKHESSGMCRRKELQIIQIIVKGRTDTEASPTHKRTYGVAADGVDWAGPRLDEVYSVGAMRKGRPPLDDIRVKVAHDDCLLLSLLSCCILTGGHHAVSWPATAKDCHSADAVEP